MRSTERAGRLYESQLFPELDSGRNVQWVIRMKIYLFQIFPSIPSFWNPVYLYFYFSDDQAIFPLRRTPLKRCPGFSCEGGLGKCLPIEARCNRVIDCLNGEDEVNCRHYPIYRQLGNVSFETVPSSTMGIPYDPTKPDEISTSGMRFEK